jgi:hypothetical protein
MKHVITVKAGRHKHKFIYALTMKPFAKDSYSIYLCQKCGMRKDACVTCGAFDHSTYEHVNEVSPK